MKTLLLLLSVSYLGQAPSTPYFGPKTMRAFCESLEDKALQEECLVSYAGVVGVLYASDQAAKDAREEGRKAGWEAGMKAGWADGYAAGQQRVAAAKPKCSQVRVGSVCRDGWPSPSTGRGTCSHHGGVAGPRYETRCE
jgi:hypothetical protein